MMKKFVATALGLSALLVATTAMAQTSYKDIKVGTALDSKGIAFGGSIKPLPLPQGTWQVVARNNNKAALSGEGTQSATPMVEFTLKSTNKGNGIAALVVEFSADSIAVDWMNEKCADPEANYVETLGTSPTSVQYACLTTTYFSGGLKEFFAGASKSSDAWVKSALGALQPEAANVADAYTHISLDVDRSAGRKVYFVIYAANRKDPAFVTATNQWAKASGQMLLNVLNNKEGAFPAFP
jgi:hypothetical protein